MMERGVVLQSDLTRGEGDWLNIQQCIRKAFLQHDEHLQKQQQQIAALQETVSSLRREISQRPKTEEAFEYIDRKIDDISSQQTRKKDFDKIK